MEGKESQEGALAKVAGKIQPPTLRLCKISPKLLHFSESHLRHHVLRFPEPSEGRKKFGFELKGEVGSVIWVGQGKGEKKEDGFINSAVSRNNHANP